MKRKKRSIDDLQGASNQLHYEFWMLKTLANGLASGIAGQGPIHNALVESFATHVRVLIEFFYPSQNPHEDTILAEDFFSPTEWAEEIRRPQARLLEDAKERADNHLAHLTYTRSEGLLDKGWPIGEIASELETVLDIFLQKVLKELLGSRWKTNRESQGKDKK